MGSTPLYKPYRVWAAPKDRALGLFGLKTFSSFWSGFEGTTGAYMYSSFQFQMNKNEIEIYELEMHLKNFCLCSNLPVVMMT